jgi:RimJ/RimL family protein N-acetyltransferase
MPITAVPTLETSRLLLREWRAGDIEGFATMSADSEVMRYLGGAHDRAESWRRMALHAGHWALRGYGNWAVERKADGAFMGRVGLWNPEGWPGLEVGWTLARAVWGQGYATEAGRAAMDWAWADLDVRRLISVIHPDNRASIRVAERLGLRALRKDTIRSEGSLDRLIVMIFGIERPNATIPAGPRP